MSERIRRIFRILSLNSEISNNIDNTILSMEKFAENFSYSFSFVRSFRKLLIVSSKAFYCLETIRSVNWNMKVISKTGGDGS
jgi:hypothetical protein